MTNLCFYECQDYNSFYDQDVSMLCPFIMFNLYIPIMFKKSQKDVEIKSSRDQN